MIHGSVNAWLELNITLSLFDSAGLDHRVDAIIDTGYSGFTLPPPIIARLRLSISGHTNARIADGSLVLLPYYEGPIGLGWNASDC